MANTYDVQITGLMHYDACPFNSEDRHEEVMRWLAYMNLPHFGIKIQYPQERYHINNSHGGKTLYQRYVISGVEAIGMNGVLELVKIFKEVGIVLTAHYRDLDNQSNWQHIKAMKELNHLQRELFSMYELAH